MVKKIVLLALMTLSVTSLCAQTVAEQAAYDVLARTVGNEVNNFIFIQERLSGTENDAYSVNCNGSEITIKGNSPVALVRGAYDYMRNASDSIVTWNGNRIDLDKLKTYSNRVESPYQFRYYFNVVTHGYTTAYWDWKRWEKELDWMAFHGMNMPLIGGAQEAILHRVWRRMGLTDEESLAYFTGPAHFPWNRMGNITRWDGPFPLSYFDKQIKLTHQQLDRMNELEMDPIIYAFAGFVPSAIKRLHPELELLDLRWGGFDVEYQAQILTPDNPLFIEIGSLYIEEWEKEFGKGKYYLADSFNEMDVPVSGTISQQKEQLAGFGESVYQAIANVNPDAVWVMQGWTFPFHRQDGQLFWTPERLEAMMSRIPDDKLMILDLANEYNTLLWNLEPSWKMYEGFFGKQWVYSFIPNMGGKVDFTGDLNLYATAPIEALNYSKRGNQVGYGTAPEGIENNEVVYELITDMGWRREAIKLDSWLDDYYRCRYGKLPQKMIESIRLLQQSVYSSFTDHPRRGFQFRRDAINMGSAHRSPEFLKAIELFFECRDELNDQPLYKVDALELAAFYLSCEAEDQAKTLSGKIGRRSREKALTPLLENLNHIDILLNNHPNHRLENWVRYARGWGDNESEKNYYEANAKRLITTWGGGVNEYSARLWGGLIRDYYAPRWDFQCGGKKIPRKSEILQWEENWITTPGNSIQTVPVNILEMAASWVALSDPKKSRR